MGSNRQKINPTLTFLQGEIPSRSARAQSRAFERWRKWEVMARDHAAFTFRATTFKLPPIVVTYTFQTYTYAFLSAGTIYPLFPCSPFFLLSYFVGNVSKANRWIALYVDISSRALHARVVCFVCSVVVRHVLFSFFLSSFSHFLTLPPRSHLSFSSSFSFPRCFPLVIPSFNTGLTGWQSNVTTQL